MSAHITAEVGHLYRMSWGGRVKCVGLTEDTVLYQDWDNWTGQTWQYQRSFFEPRIESIIT